MLKKTSVFIYILCSVFVLISSLYYPRWDKVKGEATISWDVSGYYLYLPAIFIYHDLKQLSFKEGIDQKYQPSGGGMYQSYLHESGNQVIKYSSGLAVQYAPFFFIAHILAPAFGYPADGFSLPYQMGISIGSLLIACAGLWFLRKVLLEFFNEKVTSFTLLAIVFGTNYLNYSAIDHALAHNYLFTIYALLIWLTIVFYRNPSNLKSLAIGGLIGLVALTRPTEIIAFIIPVLWGITSKSDITERLHFWQTHYQKLVLAISACIIVGSVQIFYWWYVTGDLIVYSYQDQGFSWLSPHLYNGLFSYKRGWLVYTPIMVFSLIGFIPLYRQQRKLFWVMSVFAGLFIYITFAWDIWWYGGGLGQRAMVQSYPVLVIPFAAFVQYVLNHSKVYKYALISVGVLFVYYNIWLTHQAHKGGLLDGEMTRAYFWKILGKYEVPVEARKLLDTNEEYTGIRNNVSVIYENSFEHTEVTHTCFDPGIQNQVHFCLHKEKQLSPPFTAQLSNGDAEWIRVTATIQSITKEWYLEQIASFTVRFKNEDQILKERMIRIDRLINSGETKSVYIDTRIPDATFNTVEVQFWNAESDKPKVIKDLIIEKYNET